MDKFEVVCHTHNQKLFGEVIVSQLGFDRVIRVEVRPCPVCIQKTVNKTLEVDAKPGGES